MALHHFVPQFYLKNFAVSPTNPALWVYRRTSKPQKLPIDSIAAMQRFYEVTIATTGEKSEILEHIFAQLEGQMKPLIHRLLAANSSVSFTAEEASLFSYFMALLYVRGRSFRAKVDNLRTELLKRHVQNEAKDPDTFKALAARAGYELDHETLEGMRHSLAHFDDHFTIKVKRGEDSEFLEIIFDIAKRISPSIFYKTWNLYESTEKIFVTSDNPVSVMQPVNTPPSDIDRFITGIVALPLSPFRCLLLEPGPIRRSLHVSTVDRDTVSNVNRGTMFYAHREVYSRFRSDATAKAFQRTVEGWSEELLQPDQLFE
jgi:Protein of unknown function (DUF4238)